MNIPYASILTSKTFWAGVVGIIGAIGAAATKQITWFEAAVTVFGAVQTMNLRHAQQKTTDAVIAATTDPAQTAAAQAAAK